MSRYRLEWDGSVLELETRRAGLRTEVVLFREGHRVGARTGLARALLPLRQQEDAEPDQAAPKVLVLSVLPGTASKAFLLAPKPAPPDDNGRTSEDEPKTGDAARLDDGLGELPEGMAKLVGFARAERHEFEPPPGTFAARLLAFQRKHPKLYASRHVVLAIGKVAVGLLGVALFLQVILQHVIGWIVDHLPDIPLPEVDWPGIDLPTIPWPDIDWPDITVPGWMLAMAATAKYWVPILVAIGLAVKEVRRRSRGRSSRQDQADHASPSTGDGGEDHHVDAHR